MLAFDSGKDNISQISLKCFIMNHYIPFLKSRKLKDFMRERNKLKLIAGYSFAKKKLIDLNENDISAFLSELESGREISRSTVNRYRARLHAVFNCLVKERILYYNPVSVIRKYKETARFRYLNKTEIDSLISECNKSKNFELTDIVKIALNTGMRKNEIMTLQVKDIKIKQKYLTLNSAKTKSGYSRTIPINNILLPIFSKYVSGKSLTNRIFKSSCINVAFNNALKRAKISEFRFHDLRRTFATHLKKRGASVYAISKLLGHCDIKMTETYLAEDIDMLFDAVQLLIFN